MAKKSYVGVDDVIIETGFFRNYKPKAENEAVKPEKKKAPAKSTAKKK